MTDNNELDHLYAVCQNFRAEFIDFDHLKVIKEELRMLVERDNTKSEGGVMTLMGVPGSGKTQLINSFVGGYPREVHGIRHTDGRIADRAKVVVVDMPDSGVKSVTRATYEALTLADAPKDSHYDLEAAIGHFAEEQQTKLIIYEEGHEASIDDTNKTVKAVARFA
jgi:hypothetical protein